MPRVILLASKPVTASEKVKVKVSDPSALLTMPVSLSLMVSVGAEVSKAWVY